MFLRYFMILIDQTLEQSSTTKESLIFKKVKV